MELIDLRENHKNRVIFVVGAGPSIEKNNLNLLKNHIIMAVNSGILAVPFAQYFISDDEGVQNWSYFYNLSCTYLLYKRKLEKCSSSIKNIIWFDHKGNEKLNKRGPLIRSRTSMGTAINICYQWGVKKVVLLGNDCQLSNDKYHYRYFWQYWDKEKQPYRIHGTKFSERTQNIGFDPKAFIEYWNYFAEVNKEILKEVEIIDCSDSVLECFPKKKLEDVMKGI